MIKKISGTRSYITVEFEDRTIWIDGELTLTPAFYADKKSMKSLTQPELNLSTIEREKIIDEILSSNDTNELKIFFED